MVYCSKECQQKDWKEGHKIRCKEIRGQFREFTLAPSNRFFKDVEIKMKKVSETMGKKLSSLPKPHFVVKVDFYTENNIFHIFNEDLSVVGVLNRKQSSKKFFDKMKREVLEKGTEIPEGDPGIMEAFFHVIYMEGSPAQGHRLKINLDQIISVKQWWSKTWSLF